MFLLVLIILAILPIITLVLLFLLYNSIYVVKEAEVIIIERLGKYHRTLYPGLHFIIPFIDRPRSVRWTYLFETSPGKYVIQVHKIYRIDLRESLYDFPKQNVITKDNVTIQINALLYYRIFDPKLAVYEFDNLPEGIEKLTQTTLRNVIGSMDLDETLVSRDEINDKLRSILDDATDKWGVKVNRVELQEVRPPHDIKEAMEKQMRAERDRRALILEAEGYKKSTILQAEGDQESAVLKARASAESQLIKANAEAEAKIKLAHAESEALEKVGKALPKGLDPSQYLIAQSYIKTLPKMMQGKDNKMIVVPYELSALTGSISVIKNIFDQKNS